MSQAAEELRGRAAALLQPISGDSPAGENAQYDPRHEALRSEVGKLDSLAGGEVQWPIVVSDAQALLSGTSKDILVASYLAYALMQTEGLGGLATGLEVLRGLLSDYWDTMFPPAKRLRARGNALDWLVTKLENTLPNAALSPADRPALDAVIEGFATLSGLARDKLGDAAPGMTPLSQVLQRMDMKIPKAAAEPTAPAANEGPAPTEPTPAPAPEPAPVAAPEAASAPEPAPAPQAPQAPPPAPEAAPAAEPAPAPEPKPEPEPPKGPDAEARQAAQRWLEPISPDAPTGADARYEPEYEAMRTEVGKLESAHGEEIDWVGVSKNASTILESKSKDVLAASYLAFAKWKQDGLKGLAVGLAVLAGLLETFESDRWPKRERGQGNAVGWLTGQLERVLGQHKPQPSEREALLCLQALLETTGNITRDRLEDNAPSFRPLLERTQRMLMTVPEKKAEPPPPPKPEQPTPTAAPTPSPTPQPAASPGTMPATADVGSAEEVTKYLQETGRSMIKAASLLRRAQLSSPSAYRLLRTGLYLHLDAAPPADAGGHTKIPPLPGPRRDQFALIASNGKWAALIEETESALMQFRFCLDLHRLTGQALAGLGHTDALAALAGELGALLKRMPSLPELRAADGSPLADDETREWLSETVATSTGGSSGGGASAGDGADPEVMAEARKLMTQGKAPEAIRAAQASVEAATRPRHRFVRRLDLAEMCLAGGQARLARGIFGSLEREVAELGLSEWEPALAARCLEGVVKSIRAATQKGAPADPAADLAFERLCRLDPAAAARLTKS